jgi:hypothetical protein
MLLSVSVARHDVIADASCSEFSSSSEIHVNQLLCCESGHACSYTNQMCPCSELQRSRGVWLLDALHTSMMRAQDRVTRLLTQELVSGVTEPDLSTRAKLLMGIVSQIIRDGTFPREEMTPWGPVKNMGKTPRGERRAPLSGGPPLGGPPRGGRPPKNPPQTLLWRGGVSL